MASSLLRIAVVQFAPKIGEVQANIAKARELCRELTPRSVDLVCLPEMIFTGYMFPDARAIEPFLEDPRTGPTASFCEELARRVGCAVVAGVPERPRLRVSPAAGAGANSALLYAPTPLPTAGGTAAIQEGQGHGLLHVFRKTHLFRVDRTWASPGSGFGACLVPGLGRLGVGICNDLNPRDEGGWTSVESGPYELAGWCKMERVRVLVLVNAWLKHGEQGGEGKEEEEEEASEEEVQRDEDGDEEPNWEVLGYWASRLRPLWATDAAPVAVGKTETETEPKDSERDVIVVCCNRTGRERGWTFAGSSAIFLMRPGSGRPRLLHFMGEREEGVRVWTAGIGS